MERDGRQDREQSNGLTCGHRLCVLFEEAHSTKVISTRSLSALAFSLVFAQNIDRYRGMGL